MSTASNRGLLRETCSTPGCAAVPTVKEVVKRSHGYKSPTRTYLLCDRHNTEYFGRSAWLTAEQADRIRDELVVKSGL